MVSIEMTLELEYNSAYLKNIKTFYLIIMSNKLHSKLNIKK